jgi:Arc/MetJ family transcription regulator
MKTTIEITDSLLEAAKRQARRDGTTLRELIEESLRRALESKRTKRSFQLRRCSFKGKGLAAELSGASWDAIRERAYEGHGG